MSEDDTVITLPDQLSIWAEECARHYITAVRDGDPDRAVTWARAMLFGFESRVAITRAQFGGEDA